MGLPAHLGEVDWLQSAMRLPTLQIVTSAAALSLAVPALGEPTINVFILAGQSNMVGGASVEDLPEHLLPYVEANPDVVMRSWINGVTVEPDWEVLSPRNGTSFGPEMMLGDVLARTEPDNLVAFMKVAYNGSSMHCDWNPIGCGFHLFDHLAAKVPYWSQTLESYGFSVRYSGLVLVQGESDSRAEWSANAYGANLREFINQVRELVDTPGLPFVITKVHPRHADYGFAGSVHDEMELVADLDDRVKTVSCSAIPLREDAIHFSAEGMLMLGGAIADTLRAMNVFHDDPASTCERDLNGDGSVSASDLLLILESWGPCP